jgi:predicted cupin superfamily sugar epimerase
MRDAQHWIDTLKLERHPEGGYFRETYRSQLAVPKSALPPSFGGDRSVATAIYFLLQGDDFSAFHRIASDEMWHFYSGGPLSVYVIDSGGKSSELRLGPNSNFGEMFQAVVPAGSWFGSCLAEPHSYALVGCTVAPGFDFREFEMANRSSLMAKYPEHSALIRRLTRE